MDYAGLISKAFKITLKYKFLWFLGILASLGFGGTYIPSPDFNFNLPDISPYLKQQPTPAPTIESKGVKFNLNQFEKVLGAQADNLTPVFNWMSAHFYLLIFLGILLLLFFIFLFVISTMASGGLIAGVFLIEKNKPVSFGISFKEGYHAFWRIFGINLLIALFIFLLISFFAAPTILLIFFKSYWAALGFGFLSFPILIVVSIYLGILSMYAIRFAVCQSFGVRKSIKSAHNLMTEFKKEVILVWLISVGIGLAIAIVLGILSLLILLPVMGLGLGIYAGAGLLATVFYSTTLGLILFLGFLLLSGIIQTFQSSFWTLAFLELTKSS
jgi:hypothetical protein